MKDRRRTSTSSFGVSGRESHDSSGFYGRFRAPELSRDTEIAPPTVVEQPFCCGDARSMTTVEDGSVALVITSPPYFAGKTYEEELERDGIPSSYLEYLDMLTEVFQECVRALEPGGRLCVNVANLGRKPYRSLAADIIRILEHDLGLLLRGEIIWQKGEGANGSCAWGSYRSASNPVLRDLTERVIVASKGRFDRGLSVKERAKRGLPHRSTSVTDDFLSSTLDVWTIPPESATRVGHPAPFPVELPEQLIHLYSFEDDLILDPFMGSGSTLVAAARLRRRYVGYDLDPAFVELAEQRVAAEGMPADDADERSMVAVATEALGAAGFTIAATQHRPRKTAVTVPIVAVDPQGRTWYVELGGTNTTRRRGLERPEAVFRSLGRIAALRGRLGADAPIVLATTALPESRHEAETVLRAAGPRMITDVIDLTDPAALERLRLAGTAPFGPLGPSIAPGFWTSEELEAR